jgi:hypothetical protein
MERWITVRTALFAGAILTAAPALGSPLECWVATNFAGKSAQSSEAYSFIDDTFHDGMRICLGEGGASITGNDLPLVQMGPSTVIGWSQNGRGLKVVNTYQIDRARRKLLITQSRVGTATEVAILPDYAAVFVADIAPAR